MLLLPFLPIVPLFFNVAFAESAESGFPKPGTNVSDRNTTDLSSSTCGRLVFLTENFTDCFLSPSGDYLSHDNYLDTSACSGRLEFDGKRWKRRKFRKCSIDVTIPENLIFEFLVDVIHLDCAQSSFSVLKPSETALQMPIVQFRECGLTKNSVPRNILVNSSSVTIVLSMAAYSREHYVLVTFSAVPRSALPGLVYTTTTENKGYITSSGWDGHTKYHPNMNVWFKLEIPPKHLVMISYLHLDIYKSPMMLDCNKHFLSISNKSKPDDSEAQTICGITRPKPKLYKATIMHVHFVTGTQNLKTGFKLLISFYNHTTIPQQLSDGAWNCSVPYWDDFREHFPCDLFANCAEAEDEEDCPYTNPVCPKAHFHVDGSCYIYVKRDSEITWNMARDECQRRGAYLVSLNDEREWRNVTSLLRHYNVTVYFTGLSVAPLSVPNMYRYTMQSADGTAGYFYHLKSFIETSSALCCSMDDQISTTQSKGQDNHVQSLYMVKCDTLQHSDYVCEKPTEAHEAVTFQNIRTGVPYESDRLLVCPVGHVTHRFLACDMQSACWLRNQMAVMTCYPPLSPVPPMFTCRNDIERVPYTLVCDHRPDCSDHSDEQFCVFPMCGAGLFHCGNHQCISESQKCDFIEQCLNGFDELQCKQTNFYKQHDISTYLLMSSPLQPAIITFDGRGTVSMSPLDTDSYECPETHFQCPGGQFYCLPVYVRCNQVSDCPGREDERMCESSTCPGFFRCRASSVCLHPQHTCDGVFQCPQHDDELYCNLTCPHGCTCYGHAFFCASSAPLHTYLDLRYLQAKGSKIKPDILGSNILLIYLGLASCGLQNLDLPVLKNLHTLDLSDNLLFSIASAQFIPVKQLHELILAGNPLVTHSIAANVSFQFMFLLDMSRVKIQVFDAANLQSFPNLQTLNLSFTGIETVAGMGFQSLKQIRMIDLRGCPVIHFPKDILYGLGDLQAVNADNYKLCCQVTLPEGFNLNNCQAPMDEVSSCESLLRSNEYRVVLVVSSLSALLCNLASFVFRIMSKGSVSSSFGIFVAHLCVSDFLMGLYLAMIGVADRLYQGTYMWNDMQWRHSVACHLAGFLSMVSNEVSAFIICLITLDRFLVLQFPFSHLHFQKRSSHLTCALLWCVGIIIATIPLLPVTSHWHYYSQSGICIPLPITRKTFSGQQYSFIIMIVLNFILFLMIAVGQCVIYWSIRSNSIASADANKKSKDRTIARRLITIAISDFLCWFPVGLLGLLAYNNYAIPSEFNVAIAIIVMPLNSSLNPFLYTLNVLLDRRQREREDRLYKRLMQQIQQKVGTAHSTN